MSEHILSLSRLLGHQAARDPDAVVLAAPQRTPLTYARLQQQTHEAVQALNEHGIGSGDPIAVVLANGPEMAATVLAVSAAAICAPINPCYRASEFDACFADLLPKAVIVEAGTSSPSREIARARRIPVIELAPQKEQPAGVFSLAFPTPSEVRAPFFAEPEDIALVLRTSGTTSQPKIVALSQANLLHSAWNIQRSLQLAPHDRCLNVMPLFHVHGLVGALLSTIASGGSLVCPPGFLAPKFFDWITEFRPTWYTAVPTMHQAIVARAPAYGRTIAESPLRFIRSSSAPLSPKLAERLEEIFGAPVIEAYGMTEAAHQIASNPLPPNRRKLGSVGCAAGPEVAVVDAQGAALPPEQEGDVVVRGPNVMRAYAGGPAANADAFAGEWLRTGDRGLLDAEGYLFLTGRTKEIINRGGETIAPREVDEVLLDHPAVADALAFALPDERLGEEVAAAIVLREAPSVSAADLREFASTRLADSKVPRRIVFVDEIPKGPTGKPERIGLAARLGTVADSPATATSCLKAPRDSTERLLCDLWSQVLGVPEVGTDDDFFALGGDSILAMQFLARLREATDAELSMVSFVDGPTVARLAAQLTEASGRSAQAARSAEISVSPRNGDRPLSFAQEGIWLLSHQEAESTRCNVSLRLRLDGRLNIAALERSLNEIAKRHEILRTSFPVVNNLPCQRIAPLVVLTLDTIDLLELPVEQREMQASRIGQERANQQFDLARGPLLRAHVVRLDHDEHILQLDLHHIVSDAGSRRILYRELVALYGAFESGLPAALPNLPVQYADFAHWQRQPIDASTAAAELAYWSKRLEGAPPKLNLAGERLSRSHACGEEASQPVVLSAACTDAIARFSRAQGVSTFTVLAAALAMLLHRLTRREDIVVGVPITERNRPEVQNLIGLFVNMAALRIDVSGHPTFDELLRQVREATLGACAHQRLPFDRLVDRLRPDRGRDRTPLFNVMLDFVDEPFDRIEAGSLEFTPIDVPERMPNVDMLLYVKRHEDQFNLRLHYQSALFSAENAEGILAEYTRLLDRVMEVPNGPIHSYSLDAGPTRDCSAVCVHQLFEDQASRQPDAVAAVCEERRLTYGEINRRANQLAYRLREQGVGPDVLVGLCLERSLDTIVGLLAIVKAGGAYLPLDPEYPRQRLELMVEDAGIQVLLTARPISAARLPNVDTIYVDALDDGDDSRDGNLPHETGWENLAYVLFTSGSTGRPKGVEVPHRALVNLLLSMQDEIGFSASDTFLASTTLSFDIAALEIWLPLISGGRVVVVSRDDARDPRRLIAMASACTVMQATPGVWRSLVDAGWTGSPGLKALSGGDVLPRDLAEDLLARCGGLWNGYGPTETTIYSTIHKVASADGLVPIGRPIANTQVSILDANGQSVPIGVVGELHIAGAGLARGYRVRSAGEGRLVDNPFAVNRGERIYKTGDLGRYRLDGNIEFLGRSDDQVKIRGIRVELGEIESALARHPGVRAAAAVLREDAADDARLVAYVVPVPGLRPDRGQLRDFLRDTLPLYMVPAYFEYLAALPLTSHGKVDRRALPSPDFSSRESDGPLIPPRNAIEEALLGIFVDVLKREPIGIHDDFFDLGGHSLSALQILSRIHVRLGKEIALRTFHQSPTVASLAAAVESAGAGSGQLIPRRGGIGPSRLSSAQERLWVVDRLVHESPVYSVPLLIELHGPLDRLALERALNSVLMRHEVLRTTFHRAEGSPVQVVAPSAHVVLDVLDLRDAGEDGRERLDERLRQETRKPFDLSTDLMLRATLVVLEETRHLLLLNVHHIAIDGWSLGVLFNEMSQLYEANTHQQDAPLPELPIQYADYAEWQQRRAAAIGIEPHLDYWKKRLAGASVLDLPTDRSRPSAASYRGARENFRFGKTLSSSLRELSGHDGVFTTLLAAFKVLLCRYSRQEDICVGVPSANRTCVETENLIGCFVNTLVVRTDLSGEPTFREVLRRVKDGLLEAQEHQDVPFEKVVESLHPKRHSSHSPLFQVMFAPQFRTTFEMAGVHAQVTALETGTAKFDLTLELWTEGSTIDGIVEYSTDLYDAGTVQRMLSHYRALLEAMVSSPDQRVSTAPMLTEEEHTRILVDWNDTKRPYPDVCVHELFEEQAVKRPEAVAVVHDDKYLSYRDINRRANRLARSLRASGVQADAPVGLLVERSPEMIVGMLAILKAGTAYVPLDPQYPTERLAHMVSDAGIRIVLTTTNLSGKIPPGRTDIVCLDALVVDRFDESNLSHLSRPNDLLYVMYTSGSTGSPKGVEVTHRGVVRLLFGVDYARFDADCTWLHLAPASFDASTLEIWGALLHGGRCVLYPEPRVTTRQLRDVIRQHSVNSLWLTSSLFNAVIDEAADALLPIRQLLVGGEVLSVPHVRRAIDLLPETRLINGYGPTESTTFTCCYPIPRHIDDSAPSIPIGRPIGNTRVYLVDDHFELVPPGVVGELHIAGDGLARGYRGRAELTAANFLRGRFSETRLYKTGDLARYMPDGNIEFVGRVDDQVKIRGFRIEPAEVESVLGEYPAVASVAAVVREIAPGSRHLVAYFTGTGKSEELRQYLAEKLPDYMVPAVFVQIDELPLTLSGKVDRRSLAALPIALSDTSEAPRSETEWLVHRLFADLLRRDRIGRRDNFFDLGGHSLLAIQLTARIGTALNVELPASALFAAPTIEGLAKLADTAGDRRPAAGPIPLRTDGVNTPLFCLHGIDGTVWMYRYLVNHLPAGQTIFGLEAQQFDAGDSVSIESLAARHITEVRKVQSAGPYLLCGFSYGGLLAYEMARQLRAEGETVALLAIFDSSAYVCRSAWTRTEVFLNFVQRLQGRVDALTGGHQTLTSYALEKLRYWPWKIRRSITRRKERVMEWLPEPPPSVQPDAARLLKSALNRYAPKPYAGDMVLFRATKRALTDFDVTNGWRKFVRGSIEICEFPGDHYAVMKEGPAVQALAKELSRYLPQ